MASAGGAGVGGWQIYEETNPVLDKQLSKQGYFYSPLSAPKEKDPNQEKFTWNNWGCMKKLFPGIEIDRKQAIKSITNITDLDKKDNLLTVPEVKEDLVVCAMMDIRPAALNEQYKNRIYFKSEVVARGENYGWVMGTGLSTARNISTSGDNDIHFEYNLLLFKKGENAGEVEGGYSGYNFSQMTNTTVKFFITTPTEMWLNGGKKDDNREVPRKTGTGIATVDKSNDSKNKDLLQSISVYVDEIANAEFFGNDGEFEDDGAKGFRDVHGIYVPDGKNKGGGKISEHKYYKDLSSSLKAGYKPFKEKKLQGSDLKDIQSKCYNGSMQRNHKISDSDKVWQDICYSKE